jgi:HSP20 family protein
MPIIRWHPFRDLERFFDEEFVPMIPLRWSDAVADIYEEGDNVIVEMPLAGVEVDKLDISVEDGRLTVRGSVEEKKEVKEDRYWRKEIRRGAFERSVALPVEVEGEKAEATYEKGILKVTLPKSERVKPKKVKVRVV